MKKIISMVLALVVLVTVSGCSIGDSPDTVVGVYCKAIRRCDLEELRKHFADDEETVGVDTENKVSIEFMEKFTEFSQKQSKNMHYKIGKSHIDGDRATVPVTFTYADSKDVTVEVLQEVITYLITSAFTGVDSETQQEYFTDTLFDALMSAKLKDKTTTKITFECVKNNGKWELAQLSDDVAFSVINVMLCNALKTIEYYSGSFGDSGENTDIPPEEYNWTDVNTGDTVELATIKMTIIGSEEVMMLKDEYTEPKLAQEGTKFIVVTTDIENITKSTLDFDGDFTLCDSKGRQYEEYDEAFMYFDETFSYTKLSPNIKTRGHLVYQVPVDAENCYVVSAKAGTNEAFNMFIGN